MATGRFPRRHVSPPITHHETTCKIYLPLARRVNQHSRFRLTAITAVRIRVVTRLNVIAQSRGAQSMVLSMVHRFHHLPGLNARGDIGLVRDDDNQESSLS